MATRGGNVDSIRRLVRALTAGDVMNRDLVVVPRQMLLRQAVHLLHWARANVAVVVDEQGRCVGILSPADVFRWVDAGCPDTVVAPVLRCPYQVRGRLLTGGDGVICTLADGNCPFQAVQPTTGGRHTDVCLRQETEDAPFGAVPRYLTTDIVTVPPQTPLLELVRQASEARADCLVVLEESDRPIGIVSATSVLHAIAEGKERESGVGASEETRQSDRRSR
jgi:CBS-domain-containing membrane protein